MGSISLAAGCEMEDELRPDSDSRELKFRQASTSEIEEISEVERGSSGRRGGDVYVAVGKDESSLEALRWALKNAVNPGGCVFLIHVFPPVKYIPTPVGRLSKSQVSKEQVKTYMREENFKRTNLLQKYIRLCADSNEEDPRVITSLTASPPFSCSISVHGPVTGIRAEIAVDTMLIESDAAAKAILDLIPVLNITRLVMGAKRSARRLRKGLGKSEIVQKNAPEFCKVTVVCDGKSVDLLEQHHNGLEPLSSPASSSNHSGANGRSSKTRPGMSCTCFSGKFA